MTGVALTAEGLAWGYDPGAPLGRGLSLSLDGGATLALVGPNGAGKSSLLMTLCGQVSPLAGRVHVGGADVSALTIGQRARCVAVLSQVQTLDADLTVRELTELGRTPHLGIWGRLGSRDHEAVQQALRWCDLENLAGRRLGWLSGGERQRALIAMTVAQGAPLLLLDEPTTHLDLRWRHELFELLAVLRRQTGIAVVIVLHDLAEAYREADRVIVLSHGRAEQVEADDPQRASKLALAFGVPAERVGDAL